MSWRLIFAINVPFVVITLLLIIVAVPSQQRRGVHACVDWLGAVLTFLGFTGPVLALIRLPAAGWSSPQATQHPASACCGVGEPVLGKGEEGVPADQNR